MATATLRRVVDLFYADDDFRLRLEQTPGSVNGHHAKLGGLLLHVFEVTSIARNMATTMNANTDLVVAGALLHDVESRGVRRRRRGLRPDANRAAARSRRAGVPRARAAAGRGGPVDPYAGPALDLQHMILSHHGALEFGSPVQPMTVEAEIVHWARRVPRRTT